jgi:Ni,Fe-hydrogenase III large subunit
MNSIPSFYTIYNGVAVPLRDVPVVPFAQYRTMVIAAVALGGRVVLMSGFPQSTSLSPNNGPIRVLCVVAWDEAGTLGLVITDIKNDYESLTPECPQVHLFERELWEQYGIVPQGHPWLKSVRFPSISGNGITPIAGDASFFELEGEEVHEVSVGPVHAGVIEPGHFRFQCHGENVYHLEIALGYQHRGIERMLQMPTYASQRLLLAETIAGDTTIGHASAHVQVMECLANVMVPPRALALRGIALELERLANHTGDLGALSGDAGFLPTASYCGRLRGDFLNMTALLCGSRFGRGMLCNGGVACDADSARLNELTKKLTATYCDVHNAVELLFNTASVMARFEDTGSISGITARELGLVGPAARACGIKKDIRSDFPSGIFNFALIPAAVWETGDVFARAFVRWLEIQQSVEFIQTQLTCMPEGPICTVQEGTMLPEHIAVSLIEGWRGELCHCALTDKHGSVSGYKVVDPSFHNWMGLAMSLRGQQISDFPLCNKSFNLSYCGHDL